jgi:hypothetical protein
MSDGTRALDWFSDEREFRQLCGDAQSQAGTESAQEFASDMMLKANQHGTRMYLSLKQLEYLCKLADWEIPKRVGEKASSRRREGL